MKTSETRYFVFILLFLVMFAAYVLSPGQGASIKAATTYTHRVVNK